MKKTCLIHQPAGVGDIFFCIYIALHYRKLGYNIIWPILTHLMYINDYISYDNINFVDINSDFTKKDYYNKGWNMDMVLSDEFIYLPLSTASYNVNTKYVMRAKYELVGLDFRNWSQVFEYKRNYKKENELYYDVLKLKDDSEYNFINRRYGTVPDSKENTNVMSNNNLQNITMEVVKDYSIFDWMKVIQNASYIFTVDTSILFLMEKIELNSKCLNLWRRGDTYDDIDGLFEKKYIYN